MNKKILVVDDNRHLKTVLESMAEGILEVYSERVVYANLAAVSLFGRPQEQLLGSYFIDLFDKSLQPRVESMLSAAVEKPAEIGQNTPFVLGDREVTIKSLPVKEEASTSIILIADVTEKRRLQKELQRVQGEKTKTLEKQSKRLKEANTALKILLEQSEIHKKELEEDFIANVRELVNPHLDRLKLSSLNSLQKKLVNTLESNLKNIVSPFIRKMSLKNFKLTTKEIQVANLIKNGKKNKEIAEILGLSNNTILFHRFNIRTKLGLRNKKVNLKSHLAAFDE